jgi:hypothetical protein
MKITDIIVEASCAHGQYYCSTDKKWKCRQGPKQTRKVAEGSEQIYNILALDKGNALKKPTKLKWKASSLEDIFDALAAQDWYPLEINGVEVIAGKSLKQGVAESEKNPFEKGSMGYALWRDLSKQKKLSPQQIQRNKDRWAHRQMPKGGYSDESHPIKDDGNEGRSGKQNYPGMKEEKQRLDPKCWDGYKKQGTKIKGGVRVNNCVKEELEETYDGDEFFEAYGELWYNEDEQLDEAEYQGRSVPLGKPMRGDVKKFKVYVKDPSTGNIKKVNFGDPDMKIRKSNPAARRSFRARHNCDNPGPRTKARYWSCRKW